MRFATVTISAASVGLAAVVVASSLDNTSNNTDLTPAYDDSYGNNEPEFAEATPAPEPVTEFDLPDALITVVLSGEGTDSTNFQTLVITPVTHTLGAEGEGLDAQSTGSPLHRRDEEGYEFDYNEEDGEAETTFHFFAPSEHSYHHQHPTASPTSSVPSTKESEESEDTDSAEPLITPAPEHHDHPILVARDRDWRADRDRAISRGQVARDRGRQQGRNGRDRGRENGRAANERAAANRAENRAAETADYYNNYYNDDDNDGVVTTTVTVTQGRSGTTSTTTRRRNPGMRAANAAVRAARMNMRMNRKINGYKMLRRRDWQQDLASAKSLASSYRSVATASSTVSTVTTPVVTKVDNTTATITSTLTKTLVVGTATGSSGQQDPKATENSGSEGAKVSEGVDLGAERVGRFVVVACVGMIVVFGLLL